MIFDIVRLVINIFKSQIENMSKFYWFALDGFGVNDMTDTNIGVIGQSHRNSCNVTDRNAYTNRPIVLIF